MNQQPIFIISGEQGEGKTTRLTEVVKALKSNGLVVKGFTAPGDWTENLRTDFLIKDICSHKSRLLCRDKTKEGFEKIGRFYFDPETIIFGKQILLDGKPGDLLVIDEVGKFEINGKVWSGVLNTLIKRSKNPLMITIRDQYVTDVIRHFQITNSFVFNVKEDAPAILEKVRAILNKN